MVRANNGEVLGRAYAQLTGTRTTWTNSGKGGSDRRTTRNNHYLWNILNGSSSFGHNHVTGLEAHRGGHVRAGGSRDAARPLRTDFLSRLDGLDAVDVTRDIKSETDWRGTPFKMPRLVSVADTVRRRDSSFTDSKRDERARTL